MYETSQTLLESITFELKRIVVKVDRVLAVFTWDLLEPVKGFVFVCVVRYDHSLHRADPDPCRMPLATRFAPGPVRRGRF